MTERIEKMRTDMLGKLHHALRQDIPASVFSDFTGSCEKRGMTAMQRAAELGTTISDALEFYAKHGARMTNPTLAELVVQLIGEKRQAGKSKG